MRFDSFLPWKRRKKEEPSPHDPTTSSVYLGSTSKLKRTGKIPLYGREVAQDVHGRFLYEIDRNPKDQMFLARLLKSVMPVSDVVYDSVREKYYSYKIPLDAVESKWGNFGGHSYADILILEYIFSDADHGGGSHNIVKGKDNKHALYDFELFGTFWHYSPVDTRHLSFLNSGTKEEYDALIQRLASLKQHVSGENGRSFMRSVLNNMATMRGDAPHVFSKQTIRGVEIQPTVEMFQDEVLRRIDVMLAALAYDQNADIKNT